MLINLAVVVGTVALALLAPVEISRAKAGTWPTAVSKATVGSSGKRDRAPSHRTRTPERRFAATVDSFSPPAPARANANKKKKRSAPARRPPAVAPASRSSEDEFQEEAPSPRRPAAHRRPAAPDETAGGDQDDDDDEVEEGKEGKGDEEAQPRRKPQRRRAADQDEERGEDDDDDDEEDDDDDDEEEQDAPLSSLPVVLPRLFTFSLGGSLVGRTFAFNAPLQKESTFPRPGIAVALETYPLIRFGHGWLRTLGMGASLAMEFGAAALKNSTTGATASFPVSQRRYSIDVRYALPAGRRVVIIPALGVGNNTFDLKNNMPVVPSACTSTPAMPTGIALPCLADVQVTYLIADLHLRVAASDRLAFDVSGGYFLGLAVGRGLGQIGQEKAPTMAGFRGELGATLMLSDWLAVRMAIPVVNYKFTFNSGGPPYTSAAESYYGGTVSGVLFTR